MIDAAFSFHPRQHQHQTAFKPVRCAEVVEECTRESAERMQQDPENRKAAAGEAFDSRVYLAMWSRILDLIRQCLSSCSRRRPLKYTGP